jgi:hypothetical protein
LPKPRAGVKIGLGNNYYAGRAMSILAPIIAIVLIKVILLLTCVKIRQMIRRDRDGQAKLFAISAKRPRKHRDK